MFLISYYIHQSLLHGFGVFTPIGLGKGVKIYEPTPSLDLELSPEDFGKLPSQEQSFIKHHGYIDKNTGNWKLDHDDIRFLNHSSDKNNIGLNEKGELVALREIAAGEELLQNYREFDDGGQQFAAK